MSAKTPVSVLQEMCAIKKIQTPQYVLISYGSDSVNPEFKFRVTIGNIVEAVGSGRSKKEAKHNAAETALRKLKEQDSLQDPIKSPYSNHVKRNYVGELMTFCANRPPLEAEFVEHGAEGPSHAPSFTIKCTVSKFVESAEASTKKQAKQLVAKKMLQRIQKCLKDVVVPQPKETIDELKERTTEETKIVYQKLRDPDHLRLPTTVIPNSISDLHSILKQNYSMPEPLMTLHVERDTTGWNPIKKVKDVVDTMNVKFHMEIYKGAPKGSGAWFDVATLDANPPVTVIAHASSKKEAKNKTADDLLSHLVDTLKLKD